MSLDTTVVDHLGMQETTLSPAVTLRHLLTHTSGISDDAEEEDGENYAAIWRQRASYLVRETVDFLPQFIDKPPNFAPGEGCRYCNVGYILAGLMIEHATGQRYRDQVQTTVFERAGDDRYRLLRHGRGESDAGRGCRPGRR